MNGDTPEKDPHFEDGYCLVSTVETKAGKQILKPMKVDFPVSAITGM